MTGKVERARAREEERDAGPEEAESETSVSKAGILSGLGEAKKSKTDRAAGDPETLRRPGKATVPRRPGEAKKNKTDRAAGSPETLRRIGKVKRTHMTLEATAGMAETDLVAVRAKAHDDDMTDKTMTSLGHGEMLPVKHRVTLQARCPDEILSMCRPA